MSSETAREPARRHAHGLPPIIFVLAAALLWSTGGLFIKATPLGAFELSFGRSLLAAVTVAVLTRREGYKLNAVTLVTSALYAGLLLLFVMSNKLTTAANAIFLQYTAPVYVLVLEPLLFKERFRLADLFVVIACVAGMSLFFVGRLRPQDVEGNLTALGSGVCFALFLLLLRHQRESAANRASSVIYGNLIICLVTLPAFARVAGSLALRDVLIVSYLGVVQIGLAYTLFTLGIARGVRSLDAGVVGYIEPMLNPVWVFLFLGERPSEWAVLGGCIIIAAVFAHTVALARRAKTRDGNKEAVGARL
ncbi:MAG TPA: EamA family transporter [Pyrinomonadaceae bacterium]|nr:EamA family transporter [Pyrinomonadaceae bacterium]